MKAWFVFIAIIALLAAFLIRACQPEEAKSLPGAAKTDTVYVPTIERIYVLPAAVFTPERVTIATVPDTAYRKEREAGNIITGVKVSGRSVEVQTIDPKGIVVSSSYSLPDVPTALTIDGDGKLMVVEDKRAKRRQRWAKIGRTAASIGLVVGGFILGKQL